MNQGGDNRQVSPERLAYEAHQRGDQWFQVDVAIAAVQGYAAAGSNSTRTVHEPLDDFIGAIEAHGWTLQHVSTSFVQTGSTGTKRVLHNVGSTVVATHGYLAGLYVFRRVAE
jgi:hypothetical protein